MPTLKIGTRGSQLALFQANTVAALLRERAGASCEIVVIKTSGDRLAEATLSEIGGKRLFVKEIEDALLAGTVDLAVHSSKDMPVVLPDGLTLGAVLPREDARDALVLPGSPATMPVDEVIRMLGRSPRIGTSSVRRSAQLTRLFPGATFLPIRGNLDTRLRKLDAGDYDALVLAAAGLLRLKQGARISAYVPVEACVPAPGQGIIAIEIRADDARLRELVGAINEPVAATALVVERAVVQRLGGGCQMPLGAFAELAGDTLTVRGVVISPDGSRAAHGRAQGSVRDAEQVGAAVAEQLLADGAAEILAEVIQAQAAVEGLQTMSTPMVWLIGAGPGDPGLITVRGLACLQAADVVIHDHQVSTQVLAHARGAELIDVGTAAPDAMAQQAISILLMEKAREGKRVARLKWGDPFVFGRGGEEALFLHEQGIPFEVVPGVPAAVAVPAYAGVPLSYPGGGDTITFVRSYQDETGTLPRIDWNSLARLDGTVVCYAGPQQLPRILEAMARTWPADADAAIVYQGASPDQETLAGTVAELLGLVREQPRRSGAILVVGRVVAFREHLRWFDARPLFGKRVLVTRPRDQAPELSLRLAELGAEAIESPMITIVPPDDDGPLQRAAAEPAIYDAIVFTSANAVDHFMAALLDGERDVRALKGPLLCTVGTSTAARLAQHGIKVDVVPAEFRAEAVVAALAERLSLDGARVLLPRSDIGREVVAEQLREAGAIVTEVVAYRTILDETPSPGSPDVYGMLLKGLIDVVTFTSASAVRNFVRIYGAEPALDLLKNTVVAVIGPVTAEAATQLGFTVTVCPATYTVPAMVDAIAAHFRTTAVLTTPPTTVSTPVPTASTTTPTA